VRAHCLTVPSEPAADVDDRVETAPAPRQSRVATAALVTGVVGIPFALLVYPGLLLGVLAGGRSAAAGRTAGWSPGWSRW
jgi:hypothetical protein